MNKHKILFIYCCILLLATAFTIIHLNKNNQLKNDSALPNIVYIMADDLGYGDLQCYNHDGKTFTPNIDVLAKQGVLFLNAHSSASLCTPSRYSILTGRYCWRTKLKKGVLHGYSQPLIMNTIPTIATFLKQAGYNTAAFGKWNLGFDWKTKDGRYTPFKVGSYNIKNIDFNRDFKNCPLDHGFDYYFGIPGSNDMGPYLYIKNRRVVGTPDIWATPKNFPMMRGSRETWMTKGYDLSQLDSKFTAQAKSFIDKQNPHTPFFIYYAATAPHYPWDVPDYAKGKSKDGDRGDMIYVFDHSVGELVKALKRRKLYNNTIIIITSDNGPLPGDIPKGKDPANGIFITYGHKSMGGLKGFKGNIFEGGHRIPLIVSWPGKAISGQKNDKEVCLTDIFGLIGQVLHRNIPGSALDSYGFLPLVTESNSGYKRPEPIINYAGGVYAVQSFDGWKYIQEDRLGGGIFPWREKRIVPDPKGPIPGSEGLLYDLKNDISEKKDLYKENSENVHRLSQIIKRIIKKH